jgi:magnesium chelatase family protein
MLATVSSCTPLGVEGQIVNVEVDLRRGIPGVDVVGLPDGAVREARERVRAAIRNSGFDFPRSRVLVNLAPAGMRKVGASFDLAIAVAVLAASGQVPTDRLAHTMVLGELNLAGRVLQVNGVLPAVGTGLQAGLSTFLVPRANLREAQALRRGSIRPVGNLVEAARELRSEGSHVEWSPEPESPVDWIAVHGDLADLRGHGRLRRALEIAAAGCHNLLLFGPVGSGKTMAARRLAGILPSLSRTESLEVTRIHSIAGELDPEEALVSRRPFRSPHHSASLEGLVGGGRLVRPGEVSLAHRGVLFLDEVLEFRHGLLQALREPAEDRHVTIVRAGVSVRYPAAFQLILATNVCPCGNLGAANKRCGCSGDSIRAYWRRIGHALLDRVDLRVPIVPVPIEEMLGSCGEDSRSIRARVEDAVEIQRRRYGEGASSWNGELSVGAVATHCAIAPELGKMLTEAAANHGLSSRACHSVQKVARTIADLARSDEIEETHLQEAIELRRYGDSDLYWKFN